MKKNNQSKKSNRGRPALNLVIPSKRFTAAGLAKEKKVSLLTAYKYIHKWQKSGLIKIDERAVRSDSGRGQPTSLFLISARGTASKNKNKSARQTVTA